MMKLTFSPVDVGVTPLDVGMPNWAVYLATETAVLLATTKEHMQ